jgi:hypothetical protein
MDVLIYFFVGAAIVFALVRFSGRKQQIRNPRLGFLDLTGGTAGAFIEEDKAALRDLFSSLEESKDKVPQCDVLFLYATIGDGGTLEGTDRYLRATIRDSGAKVVVVASDNPHRKPSPDKPVYGHANLVITISRNGAKFPRFFRELFVLMKKGRSMPMAWVSLVPQGPSPKHDDCPATICLMELGQIKFG